MHTRRDGALVTVASSWTLQRDESNSPVSVIEMNYDITARKKVEQELKKSRERLDAILSSSLDGIIVCEAVRDEVGVLRDLRFAMINPAAEKLMRLNASDAARAHRTGKIARLFAADGLFEKFTRIIEENVALDFEHEFRPDGLTPWYRLAGVKLGDGWRSSYYRNHSPQADGRSAQILCPTAWVGEPGIAGGYLGLGCLHRPPGMGRQNV